MAEATYNDAIQLPGTQIAADDQIPIWDTSAGQTKRASRLDVVGANILGGGTINTNAKTLNVPGDGTAALSDAANTFSAQQTFGSSLVPRARIGAYATKASIPHNSATACYTIAMAGFGTVTAAFLVTLMLSGVGKLATQVYLVTIAFSGVTVTKLSESLFAFSSVAVTGAINTSTGVVTLSVQQTNSSSETVGSNLAVLPLMVSDSATITVGSL